MSGPAELQLLLLKSESFESGPSRARGPRRLKAQTEPSHTLSLVFEPRPVAVEIPANALEDARRLAVERSRASLRARLESAAALKRSVPAAPPPSDESQVWSGGETDSAQVLVFVYLVRRKLSAVSRASMMKSFADRLGGELRRSDLFDAREGGDSVSGRLDAKSLVVRFSGPAARQRWLTTVQRLAREHDLVEPE
jgi:hypothetical protein